MTGNRWLRMIAENPGHSAWYVERFRSMAADGADLDGEARFVDAMVPRRARILDAGCGPGRVGGRLARLGHTVVGVDVDPELIAAADDDHPGPTWLTADLATLDLPTFGIAEPFDVIVCAGNVLTFLDPATHRMVMARLAAHLAPGGRIAVGSERTVGMRSANSRATPGPLGSASTFGSRPGTCARTKRRPTSWSPSCPGPSEELTAMTRPTMPDGLELVRTTDVFDQDSVPAGLLRAHRVADGVWGRLVVHTGSLTFLFEDEPDRPIDVAAGESVVIPPARQHHLELDGPATFAVEFHRFPDAPTPRPGTESTALTPDR